MSSPPAATSHALPSQVRLGELGGCPCELQERDARWSRAFLTPLALSSKLGGYTLRDFTGDCAHH
eukprot:6536180-Pyramimonas_sp.AAC.1